MLYENTDEQNSYNDIKYIHILTKNKCKTKKIRKKYEKKVGIKHFSAYFKLFFIFFHFFTCIFEKGVYSNGIYQKMRGNSSIG